MTAAAERANGMLYFVALYYRNNIFTGANKRFEELSRIYHQRLGDRFRMIVTEGEKPEWAPEDACIFVSAYHSRIDRIRAFFELRSVLRGLPAGTVISDFMPIPFSGLRHHQHFQLIYDLRNFTEFKRGGLSVLTSYFQKRQLRRSPRVLTISEYSREDIHARCGIARDRIGVSYCGVGSEYFEAAGARDKDIDILYVAAYEPRKNHLGLMDALLHASEPLSVRLIGRDIGTRQQVVERAATVMQQTPVTIEFVDRISEAELIASYQRARLYVFPSMLEGFGMPLIEALSAQCKVACSDIPVFREICEQHADYFDPRDPASIWDSIASTLASTADVRVSQDFARRFHWETIASDLLDYLAEQGALPRT